MVSTGCPGGKPRAERHEQVAFVLMMARMSSCGGCAADSFRAMRGCTQCARQSIRRFRGSDKDILAMFQQYLNEVAQFEENIETTAGMDEVQQEG
jgi:hypothetical protein